MHDFRYVGGQLSCEGVALEGLARKFGTPLYVYSQRTLTRKRGALLNSDVVGPICESGEFFCQDRPLPRVGQGDYLALLSAGAYGFVMASNYNTRALAAEVLVHGRQAALVRPRQPLDQVWAGETVAPWLR
jgi:diaminopimelate decarboxylase